MPVAIIVPDPRFWPDALRSVPARRLADGRRVVASQDLAALLGCGPANLRQMAIAGKIRREQDLDEPRRSWYTIEEVARAYLTKFPGAVMDDADDALHKRLWPELPAGTEPPIRPVTILPELVAATSADESEPLAKDELAEDKDATIARLAAALADKDAEIQRLQDALKAQTANPRRRSALQRHRPNG